MSRSMLRTPFLVVVALLIATGCKDANEPEGDAPVLPPESTFVIDLGDFIESPLAAAPVTPASAAAGTYWNRSAVVVGVWNTILTVTLAIPVAAFVESFDHTPVWNEEERFWSWSYSFTPPLGVQHSARLEARTVDEGIQWDMYISRAGGFTDFHWYNGVSNLPLTHGTWTLYREPGDPTRFIDIVWNRAATGGTYDVRYTYAVPGTDMYDSYIIYGVTGDTPYDAFYDLYAAATQNPTDIEWDRTTKEGRTRDLGWFGDNEWRCWDSLLENTDCP